MAARLTNLLQKSRQITRVHPCLYQSSYSCRCYCIQPPKRYTSTTTTPSTCKDYFPWHHSQTLSQRIANKDDLSGMPNNFRARFVRRMIAGRELNLSFWDSLPLGFEREWEEELAGNFATAYGMAMSELLKSVFQVKVENDFITVSMDSSIKETDASETDLHETESDDNSDKEVTNENNKDGNSDKNDPKRNNEIIESTPLIENEYLNSMIDKSLLARYQLVDKDSIHVKLSVKPTSAKLQHIFAIPILTREIVEQKPHLKGGYLRIEKEFEETKSYDRVRELTYALADDVGRDNFKRTVVAEAIIQCMEFFQVKDASTGEVVRGMLDGEDPEEVVHVVRFEVVTDKTEDRKGREVGNWKIIDWDDLLGGNRFH